MTYKIYTNDGKLFKTESSYCIALSYARKDLDKFTIIADSYNSSGVKIYCRLPYLPSILQEADILTVDDLKTSDKFITVKTLKYEGHIYYLQIVDGSYEQFYRID